MHGVKEYTRPLVAFLASLGVVHSAWATPSAQIAFGGGIAIPLASSTLAQSLSPGYNVAFALGYRVHPLFELAARLDHARMRRDDEGVALTTGLASTPVRFLEISGGGMQLLQVLAEVYFFPSQGNHPVVTRPYVVATIGHATYESNSVEIHYAYAGHTWREGIAAEQGSALSVGIGAGVQLLSSKRVKMRIEARYQPILRVEGRLDSVTIGAELALGF